jgi:arginine:pyruvate transaminase
LRYASLTDRLAHLGGARWALHAEARALKAAGRPVIELTIGEPDVPPPPALIETAHAAMLAGRTGYSNGRGEPALLAALAARYSRRTGRAVGTDQLLCLPGTQTALYAVMMALAGPGDAVLVADPAYATYDGVIAATGAAMVPVPLRPEAGFRLQAADLAARVSPATRVILLNTPHNPTGAVLTPADLAAIGAVARAHDLWIVSDEVYEEMVFPGATFASPFDDAALADRTVAVASISKSHAAPGFRSGWAVGSAEFCARALPLCETMLFGNQPFLADMTAAAVSAPSTVAPGMVARFARRARLIAERLDGVAGLAVSRPQAGMFALVDVRAVCPRGEVFARRLLHERDVAVMPGESFGASLQGWLRLSLTQDDALVAEACDRIADLARGWG